MLFCTLLFFSVGLVDSTSFRPGYAATVTDWQTPVTSPNQVPEVLARTQVESAVTEAADIIDRSMWSGYDSVLEPLPTDLPDELFRRYVSLESASGESPLPETKNWPPGPPERNVQVMGLQNTGTNLLTSMLLRNFGHRLTYFDLSVHEDTQNTTYYRHGIWKHASLSAKLKFDAEEMEELKREGVWALIMVRDPLSWLNSMRKAPYELEACATNETWIVGPCWHPIPGGYRSKAPARWYKNLATMWKRWASSDETGAAFAGRIIIPYEDLVTYPEETMSWIAGALGMTEPESWVVAEDSAKNHGDSHGREEALAIIHSKSYLAEYTAADIQEVCASVDKEIMIGFGYEECVSEAEGEANAEEYQDMTDTVSEFLNLMKDSKLGIKAIHDARVNGEPCNASLLHGLVERQ